MNERSPAVRMDWAVRATAFVRRRFTRWKRRNSWVRHLVPVRVARAVLRAADRASALQRHAVPVAARSRYTNLFHCCVNKTGSQWLRSVLSDVRTYQYSGLWHHSPSFRRPGARGMPPIPERMVDEAFPADRIVGPLMITYENFRRVPKAGSYRAFFVMRDPRDLLVSWYFSARNSHVVVPASPLARARAALRSMPRVNGLAWAVDHLAERGHFAALGSWTAAADDPRVLLVRFEDLAGEGDASLAAFRRLFSFLDIRMPEPVLRQLLDAYSFATLTGRRRGQESRRSHLRGGPAGEWRRHFTPEIARRFDTVTGDLAERLGYDAA